MTDSLSGLGGRNRKKFLVFLLGFEKPPGKSRSILGGSEFLSILSITDWRFSPSLIPLLTALAGKVLGALVTIFDGVALHRWRGLATRFGIRRDLAALGCESLGAFNQEGGKTT